MKNKVLQTIADYNMLSHGDTVVVGVSGGADSMALLHILSSVSEAYSLHLIAAHFNHGIRGVQADADEQFVRSHCIENGIDFVRGFCDIPAKAKEMQTGIEECARQMRYSFLQGICENAKIATAHTLSDSSESFLLNFARGTGIAGLCGIPPVRDRIIRPLIFCTGREVREYNKEHGIAWCEDASNADTVYSRNKVRHHIVPVLREINSSFESNADRCMRLLRADQEFLNAMAEEKYSSCLLTEGQLSVMELDRLPDALANRILHIFLNACGCSELSYRQILLLRNLQENECITLHGKMIIERRYGCLQKRLPKGEAVAVSLPIPSADAVYPFADGFVSVRSLPYDPQKLSSALNVADADKVGRLCLRTRLAGDALRLKKRSCTKSFKQLCNEHRIPVSERPSIAVISDDRGVIWIKGFGVDESRLPDENTKSILVFEWRNRNAQ